MKINESEFNEIFGENLSKLLERRGMSQNEFARRMGVSSATASNWCRGQKTPRMDKVDKICEMFHISRSKLINKDDSESEPLRAVKIPILGTVIAGMPISAYEEVLGYEEITPDMAETGEFYALRVRGDSMTPRICEGDVVIVRVQPDVECGEMAVVLVNGEDATIKNVQKNPDGITLMPNNRAYTPRFFTNRQIQELPVVISGKVVELRARL